MAACSAESMQASVIVPPLADGSGRSARKTGTTVLKTKFSYELKLTKLQ